MEPNSWRDLRDQLTGQDVADLDYLETFRDASAEYLLDEARKRIEVRQSA